MTISPASAASESTENLAIISNVTLLILQMDANQVARQLTVELPAFSLQVAESQPRFASLLEQLKTHPRFDSAAAVRALASTVPGVYDLWNLDA